MDLFIELVIKVIPLYLLIGLGVLAGRKAKVSKDSVANLLVYFIEPAVVLLSLAGSNFDISYALLPLVMFCICLGLGYIMQRIGKIFWQDNTPNLLFFATSTPNTMFFGIPIVMACLGPAYVGIYILTQIGLYFFTFTIGYFVLARGNFTARESIKKLLSLPVLWALLISVPLGFIEFNVPEIVITYRQHLTGTMIVLGMMMVGLALAQFEDFKVDLKILTTLFALRYILWPVAMVVLIALDTYLFGLYPVEIHRMLLIFGTLPMAISFVTYAVQTEVQPAVAATAVLFTSLFSLFYIPIVFGFLL